MKVIMLFGKTNCGKTTTFHCLRNKLKSLGGVEAYFEEVENPDKDFVSEMEYKGKRLVLVSMGDWSGYLVDKIKKCDTERYDIFVFACNKDKIRPQQRFMKFEDRHIIRKNEANDADNERAMTEIIKLLA